MIESIKEELIKELTPKEIVKELDRYIVGQGNAKKAVAISLRNRWRRRFVSELMRDEILPKNILMVGPTGVGKTEIARRIAKIVKSPFIKVEATKFTEVGYVGKDVESIIRELVDISVNMVKKNMREKVSHIAKEKAYNRILDIVVEDSKSEETRNYFKQKLLSGELDNQEITIKIQEAPANNGMDLSNMGGVSMGVINISDVLGKMGIGERTKSANLAVKNALEKITAEESDKLIDEEQTIKLALDLAQNGSIVFIDEIDKICGRGDSSGGGRAEISREGVQRDLLPLVEGTIVNTKYGAIKTDHILFISSGAFHSSKPSDLIPELQGRFPIRVKLNSLNYDDMLKILKDTEMSLPKQYKELIGVENVELEFTKGGLETIAKLAIEFNQNIENLGARRLYALLEKVLEDISFDASEKSGETFILDKKYILDKINPEDDENYIDLYKQIL